MSSSSDYLSRKKSNMFSSSNTLNNDSVSRLAKSFSQNGNEVATINTNIFNSKVKYLYSTQNIDNGFYTNANNFPLLIFNSGNCGLTALFNDYSINKINYYLGFLKQDEYDSVFSELTTDETQKILYGLYKLKTSVSDSFATLIDLYESIFMSIKYFYFLYTELKNNEANCLKYKEDSEILNDMKRLKEYIEEQKRNIYSSTTMNIQVAKLNIKPEYLRYIELYGMPYKLMFDPVLLQEIIDEMKK